MRRVPAWQMGGGTRQSSWKAESSTNTKEDLGMNK